MPSEQGLDFLVFVHVHYPEIWEEMRRELAAKIATPFGLVATYRRGLAAPALPDTPYLRFSRMIEVENRGRDILPFMKALRADLPKVDIGLKIHTKRSPHRIDGADWRAFMCGSLLSSNDDGLTALRLLSQEKRVALIAPEGHLLSLKGRLGLNRRAMNKMAKILTGEPLPLDVESYRFSAGSMFWFRPSALAPFANKALEHQFPAERGQLDGTAAHAAERLFALVVERQGLIAAGMEAVDPILTRLEGGGTVATPEIRHLVETRSQATGNPFIVPLADLWRRHRGLFFLAQLAYVYLPRPVTRLLRTLVRYFLT